MASLGYEGFACRLRDEQQDELKAWISETLPRTTRERGAWIEKEHDIAYQGRSGLIALLDRLGMEHCKQTISASACRSRQHFGATYWRLDGISAGRRTWLDRNGDGRCIASNAGGIRIFGAGKTRTASNPAA